ncbi:MAG: 1-acyl-sn-glycerol-3-phosphate acyltransferase [Gammaproteobacteria bacterium]|jgi:1-acyl-sn-glycerol-3-phosphate acyltransferase
MTSTDTTTDLLRSRRFAPLFITQFLGALNDNLFKNAVLVMLTFPLLVSAQSAPALVNLAAALFVVPFVVLSALAGQLADRLERSALIRLIKLAEIVIMAFGALAVLTANLTLMLLVLLAMGTQSTFFGPLKYTVLAQQLHDHELMAGNAIIEFGTFAAIILGTTLAALQLSSGDAGQWMVAGSLLTVAVLGWLASTAITSAPAPGAVSDSEPRSLAAVQPSLTPPLGLNPITASADLIRRARRVRSVWLSILGISWFWVFAALILTQLPVYSRDVLHADANSAALLMSACCVGIGLGALLCARLSSGRIELGLVPLGALGMSIFAADLSTVVPILISPARVMSAAESVVALNVTQFLDYGWARHVLIDITLLAISAGLFTVPLYAHVQHASADAERGRVIAANNLLNALFMVAGALVAAALLSVGVDIPGLFLTLAVMNFAVSVFIFTTVPEFIVRLCAWTLIHTLYRVEKESMQHIPRAGAAVLVCNHVSFVDALLIGAASPRPVRFVMDHRIFATPVLRWIFLASRAIPIAPAREDQALLDAAYEEIAVALADGELVCIFPEGRLTADGEMNSFKSGIDKILRRSPVTVVPLALRGLWGSFFSRHGERTLKTFWQRWNARLSIVSGLPIPASQAAAEALQRQVADLRGEWR